MKTLAASLCIITLLAIYGCSSPNEVIERNEWRAVNELSGVTIRDIKVINDELFAAGIRGSKGVVFKSSDGSSWMPAIPEDNLFSNVVDAIELWNGKIIAAATGKPLCIIEKDTILPISRPLGLEVSEMIVSGNKVLIGTRNGYDCIIYEADSLVHIQDYLYTYYGCQKQSGIVNIAISKMIHKKEDNPQSILIANYVANHFVTSFSKNAIDCFPHDNLSIEDKYFGADDITYAGETLFAGTFAHVLYYDEAGGWKQYKDSLPKTPGSFYPYATALAYDNLANDLYIGTNYIGVIHWREGKGWEAINEGIPQSPEKFYDAVSDLVYFKKNLFLAYGNSKRWKSRSSGLLRINL